MFGIISPSIGRIMKDSCFMFGSGGFDVRLNLRIGYRFRSSSKCFLIVNIITTRLFISWPTVLSLEYHGALHFVVRGTSAK